MNVDGTSPANPEDCGGHRRTDAEIEGQVRAAYGPRLEACERLHAFGEDALYAWAGRPIDPDAIDPIILAEGARATKTYGGILRLASGGFGPQASMLSRSVFEGMAIAHWAHANPERAVELFKKHGRHSELLWRDALAKADQADAPAVDADTEGERRELSGLFGKYGTKLWTGHGSLHALLPEIEDQWPDGPPREQLWWFFRVAHRDNNQVLHSTALGLTAGMTRMPDALSLDVGPSELYLDRGLLGGLWCYEQTLTLLWDHFAIPGREALDEIAKSAQAAFEGT
jgi:hypothetical protein